MDARLNIVGLRVHDLYQQGVLLHRNPTQFGDIKGRTVVIVVMHAVCHSKVALRESVLKSSVIHLLIEVAQLVVKLLYEEIIGNSFSFGNFVEVWR